MLQIAIWDWEKVHERSVYKPHGALTNNIRFLPGRGGHAAVSCGTDGKLKVHHRPSPCILAPMRGPIPILQLCGKASSCKAICTQNPGRTWLSERNMRRSSVAVPPGWCQTHWATVHLSDPV